MFSDATKTIFQYILKIIKDLQYSLFRRELLISWFFRTLQKIKCGVEFERRLIVGNFSRESEDVAYLLFQSVLKDINESCYLKMIHQYLIHMEAKGDAICNGSEMRHVMHCIHSIFNMIRMRPINYDGNSNNALFINIKMFFLKKKTLQMIQGR